MGTSKSNHGPDDRPPLLPPWAGSGGEDGGGEGGDDADVGAEGGDGSGDGDEGAGDGDSPDGGLPGDGTTSVLGRPTWRATRRTVGSVASGSVGGGRGREAVRSGVRSAVGAMGGSTGASQASAAGRQSAGRLATFLSGVATTGVANAARTLGLAEFLDRSADVFLLQLGDVLAPDGALTEEAIARDAMDDTLQELYEELDLANGVAALDRMTPAMMADALLRYVTNYIYARVIHALTAHIHAKSPTVTRMSEIERTARYYIEDAVRLDVDTTAFFGAGGAAFAARWDAGEGQRVIDRLFEESYRVVQAGLRHGDRGAA